MGKKQTIRINESQLKQIVAESVKRILEDEEFHNFYKVSDIPEKWEENPYLEDPDQTYYYDAPVAKTEFPWDVVHSWELFKGRKSDLDRLYGNVGQHYLHRIWGNPNINDRRGGAHRFVRGDFDEDLGL